MTAVNVFDDDYKLLYELAENAGVSIADVIEDLIDETFGTAR